MGKIDRGSDSIHSPGSYLKKSDPSQKMDRDLVNLRRQVNQQKAEHKRSLEDFDAMEGQAEINKIYAEFNRAAKAGNLKKARQIHASLQKKLEAHRQLPKDIQASRKRTGGSVNKAVPKRPSGKGKPYRPRSKPNRKGKIMGGYKAGGKV